MSKLFWLVYDVIMKDYEVPVEYIESLNEIIKVARLNKVLLHFLRRLDVKHDLKRSEESKLLKTVNLVRKLSEVLSGLRYVFFKLVKPIMYVPADIDILIDKRDIVTATSRIIAMGFNVDVLEPYCVTLRRDNFILDLYSHPTLGGVIYINGEHLLKHKKIVSFYGTKIPIIEGYAEALITIAHAIYKEKLYTLNDYVTVKKWFAKDTLELARECKCEHAVELALKINDSVERGNLTLPYKIPFPLWIKVLMSKVINDDIARITSINLLKALKDLRIGRQILSKLTRETY